MGRKDWLVKRKCSLSPSSLFCSIKHYRIHMRLKNEQPLLCVVSIKGCTNRSHLFPICHPFTPAWGSDLLHLFKANFRNQAVHLEAKTLKMQDYSSDEELWLVPSLPSPSISPVWASEYPLLVSCLTAHLSSHTEPARHPAKGSASLQASDYLAAITRHVWETASRYLPSDSWFSPAGFCLTANLLLDLFICPFADSSLFPLYLMH